MGLFRHLGGRAKFALLATGISLVIAVPLFAGTFAIFDRTFVRRTGEPQTVSFEAPARSTGALLHIESHDVSSAVITLNGANVVTPNDFTPQVAVIEKPISLTAGTNRMTVEIRGEPEDRLRLRIIITDNEPPVITATVDPPANAAGWHRGDARSGVAECPPPVVIGESTSGRTIEGTVRDRAGRTATTSVTVKVDLIPPSIQAFSSASGVTNGDVTVRFECSDAESGIERCPDPVVVTSDGPNQHVEGTAYDRAGRRPSRLQRIVRRTHPVGTTRPWR